MPITVIHEGHTIVAELSGFTGVEKVLYDGKEVSSKFSISGTTHIFRVTEKGEEVQYEVEVGTRWHGFSGWVVIKRNGITIYSDR